MRILQVYKDVFPFTNGGIERYIHDLSSFLAQRGHEVAVLTAGSGLRQKSASVSGFTVIELPALGRVLSNPISLSYGRAMRRWRPDVAHFHLPLPTAEVARLMDPGETPFIATYHSDIVRQAFLLPLYGPLLKKFLKRAFLVLATSGRYARTSPYLKGLDNLRVVPIGVDLSHFAPGSEGRADHFLFVGRFRSYKGIQILLDAWKAMASPPPLVLAGGGPMEGWIRERITALPVRIILNPTDDELLALYRTAAALVLPSDRRSEAYGMVQLEAMACGTPVISTNLPTGVPWVNRHMKTGLVVPPGNATALAEAVARIRDDGPLSQELSRGALERAQRTFDSKRLFQEVESCLTEAASRSPRR
ncbi:MAG: glycosyltransferase [Candidatus Fermentibacteraceae bacterium]